MSSGGLALGAIVHASAGIVIEPIDLVPNLQQLRAVPHGDAELGQDRFDVERLRFGVLVRHVAHVQDQVGFDHLFQRRAKCRHQHRRQIRDESNGIGEDDAQSLRQINRPQGWIERGEQHVGGEHAALAQAIEQG